MRRGLARALLACALLLGCATDSHLTRSTLALELDRWIEIRTPLFSIATNVSEAEMLRMARQLLAFTGLMREIMRIGRVEPALPMRIYVFARGEQFELFPVRNAAGYAVPTLHGTVVVLSLEPAGLATPILFHEYVHYLLLNADRLAYPAWYHEGLAELLGSTVIREDVAYVGGIPHWRAASLAESGHISLETLFDATDPGARGLRGANDFYAEAWLLVHYLHTSQGLHGGPDRFHPMLELLGQLNRGLDWREAFARSFDVSLEQLEAELEAHRERIGQELSLLTLTLSETGPAPTVRPLSRPESSALLGELALIVRQPLLAQVLLEDSLSARPDPQTRALRALGAAQLEDLGSAMSEIAIALQLAPDDARVQESLGDIWAMRAYRERTHAHLTPAREAYERAVALAPEAPSAWAALGATFREGGNCAGVRRGVDALERARKLAPWHPGISLDLGRLYRRLGDAEAARERLRFVTSLAHGSELVEQAREVLRELDAGAQANC